MRKKEWNPSVYIPNSFDQEIDHKKKLLDIRIGLQNHKNTVFKKKKLAVGCDTRNNFNLTNGYNIDYSRDKQIESKPWNVSNYVDKNNLKENYYKNLEKAKINTVLKEKTRLKNYIKPENFQDEFQEKLRVEKQINKQLMNNLREKYIYDNPDSTQEKIIGGVYRLFKEYQHKSFQTSYLTNIKNYKDLKNLVKKNSKYYTNFPKIVNNKTNKTNNPNLKIDDIIKKMQVIKNEKKTKKKLNWIYENY